MKQLAIHALILSPVFYAASKYGIREAKKFIENRPHLEPYKYWIEYLAMLLMILVGVAAIVLLIWWQGGFQGGNPDDSGM
ncbi:MAG: hypothetical protein EOO13_19760 [Chitinophagaceae bacterium]|nr:MAG: hypothetical protein EOO13_19760 [Chitinophagaceae bacterium]